ncbi:MAG: alkaline phosphatase family protein [Opitutaceae bacterium]
MKAATLILAWGIAAAAAARGGAQGPDGSAVPGPQPDGYTLLHNQRLIHPVGDQVPLGDFPVGMAVNPLGTAAAVLHAGYGRHEIRMVDLASKSVFASVALREGFGGVGFSPDGRTLLCSGGSEGVLHRFRFSGGHLAALPDVRVAGREDGGVVAGFALSRDGGSAVVAIAYDNRVVRVDLPGGAIRWTALVGREVGRRPRPSVDALAPNETGGVRGLIEDADPLNVVWDEPRHRAYASLWGESSVAVIDSADGRVVARWPTGLHPNEMVLSRDGRLFVSNGGLNTVSVLDVSDGAVTEVLCSSSSPGDLPGATPDSLALAPDGRTLYVANAYTDSIAVFDVGTRGSGRPLGFIPTGWFPSSVRLTPDGRTLLVLCARGLEARPSALVGGAWRKITGLYAGSLGVVPLPRGDAFARAMAQWTGIAERCRPAAPAPPSAGSPIPAHPGDPTPIRYVVYVIKENRTYDQVLGDLVQGNGDPALCLFPERVTPNIHALARQFVLLDNFYANAEVSASGHEWSMAGYSAEFVERSWPVEYGHHSSTHVPYPSEGDYAAAVPALGYLWDRAAAAGVSYRSYGEFTHNPSRAGDPVWTNMPALKGHVDPLFRGWDIDYPDRLRADEFIAQLHRFEAQGEMPRLQILRLPQDHTAGAKAGSRTPEAMVADNDLALGRVVEALSRSRFWKETAVFCVEDDSQSGPDHVDAHRTLALVAGAFVRRGAVDSTPYTTCSMLRTIELILGLEPMSQFDAAAAPMRACFQPAPDLAPFKALAAGVSTESLNPSRGRGAEASARFDFSREDLVDDQELNRVIWAAVRGGASRMPAPVHAAFVRRLPAGGDDDDD